MSKVIAILNLTNPTSIRLRLGLISNFLNTLRKVHTRFYLILAYCPWDLEFSLPALYHDYMVTKTALGLGIFWFVNGAGFELESDSFKSWIKTTSRLPSQSSTCTNVSMFIK